MTAAVSIINLSKRFPSAVGYRQLLPGHRPKEVTALDDVSLEVVEGELLGLLGPNGAGKTTLMKILATLVLPTSGRATVYGRDVVASDEEVRRLVGMITADERSFYWRLTGRQNLEFFAAIYQLRGQTARRRVAELLDLLGLSVAADRRFQSYSTGMRQKMAIARGLLSNPRLLLVDEPTRSLDPVSAHSVRVFLKERIARTGCTILLATHQLAEAEQMCDRVAILHQGRLLASGSVEGLRLADRRDRCRLEVSGLSCDRWRHIVHTPGVNDMRIVEEKGSAVTLDLGLADVRSVLPRVIREIVASGGSIHGCETRPQSLEELFADLVQGAPRLECSDGLREAVGAGAAVSC